MKQKKISSKLLHDWLKAVGVKYKAEDMYKQFISTVPIKFADGEELKNILVSDEMMAWIHGVEKELELQKGALVNSLYVSIIDNRPSMI